MEALFKMSSLINQYVITRNLFEVEISNIIERLIDRSPDNIHREIEQQQQVYEYAILS